MVGHGQIGRGLGKLGKGRRVKSKSIEEEERNKGRGREEGYRLAETQAGERT